MVELSADESVHQESFHCISIATSVLSFLGYCIRRHRDIFRFILIYLIIAYYVPQGKRKKPWFEQTAETGMLSNAGEEKEVVGTLLPVEAAKEEVVVEPGVEDNTLVGESRSVIAR